MSTARTILEPCRTGITSFAVLLHWAATKRHPSRHGLHFVELPFKAHPNIPLGEFQPDPYTDHSIAEKLKGEKGSVPCMCYETSWSKRKRME
jgi:hypothetical protein